MRVFLFSFKPNAASLYVYTYIYIYIQKHIYNIRITFSRPPGRAEFGVLLRLRADPVLGCGAVAPGAAGAAGALRPGGALLPELRRRELGGVGWYCRGWVEGTCFWGGVKGGPKGETGECGLKGTLNKSIKPNIWGLIKVLGKDTTTHFGLLRVKWLPFA